MHPIMFGGLMVAAFVFPIYGHREFVAVWILNLAEKVNRWVETAGEKAQEQDTKMEDES